MKINVCFYPIPRIVFTDKQLKDKDKFLLTLIISLTFKTGYCFATNAYLAKELNVSKRTINNSLVNLKEQKWIKIKTVNKQRRIYLNEQRGMILYSYEDEEYCNMPIEEYYNHNRIINNKKNNNRRYLKEDVPMWMKNPEMCNLKPITEDYERNLQEILEEYY